MRSETHFFLSLPFFPAVFLHLHDALAGPRDPVRLLRRPRLRGHRRRALLQDGVGLGPAGGRPAAAAGLRGPQGQRAGPEAPVPPGGPGQPRVLRAGRGPGAEHHLVHQRGEGAAITSCVLRESKCRLIYVVLF